MMWAGEKHGFCSDGMVAGMGCKTLAARVGSPGKMGAWARIALQLTCLHAPPRCTKHA